MPSYFHVGILVADLDASIRSWQETLGVPFQPPQSMPSTATWRDQRMVTEVRVSYSTQAPYIELIQGQPGGFLSLEEHGEGSHHLGVWCAPGLAEPGGRFGRLGLDVTVESPQSAACNYLTTPGSLNGVRLELVDERLRPDLEAWLAGSAPDAWT